MKQMTFNQFCTAAAVTERREAFYAWLTADGRKPGLMSEYDWHMSYVTFCIEVELEELADAFLPAEA
jgi:hypothetical protein